MNGLFQNTYRIDSTRLQNWNYGWNGAYFVTICTQGWKCFFGKIEISETDDPAMKLTGLGKIAHNHWQQIPQHHPFIRLGEHIIMPNHVHGIIIIDKEEDSNVDKPPVETRLIASLQAENAQGGATKNFNPMLQSNLARVIRWYKGATAFECRKTYPAFAWQSRYHDHIIRNESSFQKITSYILTNPLRWRKDRYFSLPKS